MNATRANARDPAHVTRALSQKQRMERRVVRQRNVRPVIAQMEFAAIAGVWGRVKPAVQRKKAVGQTARAATSRMTKIPMMNAGAELVMDQVSANNTMECLA